LNWNREGKIMAMSNWDMQQELEDATYVREDVRGQRVIYQASTGRKGWIGTISKGDMKYVWILYDNGVEQRYSKNALEWLISSDEGYIMKLGDYNNGKRLGMNDMTEYQEEETVVRPTVVTASYIVICKGSGKVIPFFNVEDAEQFCTEQITKSHNMHEFTIFAYSFEMATKAPEVVRSVNLENKYGN
jgi:hypothetical protein